MTNNTLCLLTITDTCKTVGISVGKMEDVERRLSKKGLHPVARVRGEQAGKVVFRPLYHKETVEAFNAAGALQYKLIEPSQSDLASRLAALEAKIGDNQ